MKKLIFVSTGRCGTKRLSEILKEHLPKNDFSVQHQMDISRFANIIGNIMYYVGQWEWLKEKMYHHILKKYAKDKHFISTDPLTAMIIPKIIIEDPETHIVHIIRDREAFATSFFRFTRQRFLSFFAHNFIPFWQIGVWPLENVLNKKIKMRYKTVWKNKNKWFKKKYMLDDNFQIIQFRDLFSTDKISGIIKNWSDVKLKIPKQDLIFKSNSTKK